MLLKQQEKERIREQAEQELKLLAKKGKKAPVVADPAPEEN